ncbi:hypothetical protein EXS54_02955 [Patescibacteria group bacterium]|nr:hypothetical protein [Patescibacteria group bacterium]
MKIRIPKLKNLRWSLLAVLAAGFILPALMQTVVLPQVVQAQGRAGGLNYQGPQEAIQQAEDDNAAADRPFVLEPMTSFLKGMTNRDLACDGFFNNSGHCNPNGDHSSLHLPLYVRDGGYVPQPGSKLAKYKGNPYLSVASQTDGDFHPSDLPSGVNPEKINFVLTEVENRDKPDLDLFGDKEGNLFIFRNEYNKSLAIGVLADHQDPLGRDPRERGDKHFAYASSCRSSFNQDSHISDTSVTDIGKLADKTSDAEDKDALEADLKEKGYKNIEICDTNTSTFAEAIKNVIGSVAEFFSSLINTASGWLSDLVDVGTIANVPGLTKAWLTIRDFVNIIFIVILSVIAMATILRVDTEKYSVRSLLPRLVFAVIAVNFSLLLVQIMTNLAFILSQPFLAVSRELITNPPVDGSIINPDAGIGPAAVAVVVLFFVFISMLILAFFFLIRILVIWLLAALSPFVFLFMILPVTRSLSSNWWKNAVKWIFMAPVSFVILFIAAEVISGGSANDAVSDPQDPGFILKVGFFAGALIAAVIIPLKLGGEVMGRAVGGAKKAGSFGKKGAGLVGKGALSTKTGRTAQAYLGQRKKAQEQDAQLRATGLQGRIAQSMPGRFGQALTGGTPAQIGAQQASLENKYGQDIQQMGNKVGNPQRKLIAEGNSAQLKKDGLYAAASLADDEVGRRAAGKLLAQDGMLTQEYLSSLPADKQQEQIAAGNQAYMKNHDPVLASMDPNGDRSEAALTGIESHIGAVGPEATKEMYWGSMHKSSFQPGHEGDAGQRAFHAVTNVAASENVKVGGRNRISNASDRSSFIRGVIRHGNAKAREDMWKQLKQKEKDGGDPEAVKRHQKLYDAAKAGKLT